MALDPRALTQAPDLAAAVALAREGLTLQAIGDELGHGRQWASRLLTRHGYRIAELRNVRCAACAGLVGKAELATRSGRHYCAAGKCHAAYERDQRAVGLMGRGHGNG